MFSFLIENIFLLKVFDNLFGYMKNILMSEKRLIVCCFIDNCEVKWSMNEIIKKVDMMEDERIFFEFMVLFNLIYYKESEIFECFFCGKFC